MAQQIMDLYGGAQSQIGLDKIDPAAAKAKQKPIDSNTGAAIPSDATAIKTTKYSDTVKK